MHTSERYIRQIQLRGFGKEGQEKLAISKVLVVGAGGLGIPVAQYLTAMGVGVLGLVDGDTITISNLHRQVLYRDEDLGKKKVEVCKERLAKQNPTISLQVHPYFLSRENVLELFLPYDLIIDATDNFETRYLINDACVILKKPFVYGALQGYEGQVSVFNLGDGPTYRCLYPIPPESGQIPDCNQAGVLGIVPGIIGSHQALEAIKVLTGAAPPLSGELLVLDFFRQRHFKIKLKANPSYKQLEKLKDSYILAPCTQPISISPEELESWYKTGKEFVLIDVRESYEFQDEHLTGSHSVPLSRWEDHGLDFPVHLPWVLACQSGGRSQKAIVLIQQKFPGITMFNLEGGLDQWFQEVGNAYLKN